MIFTQKSLYYKIINKTITIIAVVSFVGSLVTVKVVQAQETTPQFLCNATNTTVIEEELDMKTWVLNRIKEAGLDPDEATVIINCESRWDPDAMGINKNHTADLGLWQINSIHKDISNVDKLDYKKATDWAINKRLEQGHWYDWACARKIVRR